MKATHDYIVPAKSWDQIGLAAEEVRRLLHVERTPYFPVVDIIESVLDNQLGLLSFEIDPEEEMGEAEGYTAPDGSLIILREDVYVAACNGEARARFTSAHELGHWFMHTNIPLARAPSRGAKPYRLAEPQANAFAAEILMPRRFVTSADTVATIMARHGVSAEAATNRIKFLKNKGII
ncbi:ImmA/IrrE family metallo-endopeptidase [Nitratireductor kimnyeongensis]|uniref:ImmA/IrrE family metallo-endopeptidase n=1 Tax=Nitratireductor kimnyeongensis TaxID=430679 RepID=A0ABW0TBI5_9HYPH|nr:ImmA/IrrE family metallo-endopeptidase [Nitratireductor kimnyeongensis]QZZ37127.1 ImmA/IrrE family metallo-endopeptidase [Nitratireductor kimnyeongensis]